MPEDGARRAIERSVVFTAVAFAFTETGILPELPRLQKQLGGGAGTMVAALLESAYLVVASVSAPTLGKLGDKAGKKGPLVAALLTYVAGAIGAGFSPDVWVLIAFRALQGVGGAMFAIALSVLRDHRGADDLGVAIGKTVGGFGAGVTLGFGTSGLITAWFGWRWIFFIGAALVAGALVSVVHDIPRSTPRPDVRVEPASVALLSAALVCLVGGLAFAEDLGWGSALDTLLLAAFPVLFSLWIWRDAVSRHPLLDVKVLADPRVLLPNLGSFLSGMSAFSIFFLAPRLLVPPRHVPAAAARHLGYGLGVSDPLLGAMLVPVGLGVLAGGPLGGWIGRRWTGKWPFTGGMVTLALGCFFLALWHDAPLPVLAWFLLVGLGFGAAVGATGTFVAETVDPSVTSVAMALNSLMRLVGGSVGAQIVAAVLVRSPVPGASVPRESAIVASLVLCASTSLLGAVLAALVPASGARRAPPPRHRRPTPSVTPPPGGALASRSRSR